MSLNQAPSLNEQVGTAHPTCKHSTTNSTQGVAFYLAIGAAVAELSTLLTLAITTTSSPDQYIPGPKDDHEKKRSMSISGSTKRYP